MSDTVYIATPTFNSEETIDTTILSVIAQEGDFNIRYHIQDGGSNDGTWHKLKHWQTLIDGGYFPKRCRNICFTFSRESDRGMYDALYKAFGVLSAPDEAFVGWINSDDWINLGVFQILSKLSDLFEQEELAWLIGTTSVNKNGMYSGLRNIRFPQEVVKAGLCDGMHWPFLQQEGTFFRQSLLNQIDLGNEFRCFQMAGDWNLWRRFAEIAVPVTLDYPLAAFRSHSGQLTAGHFDEYRREMDDTVSIRDRASSAKLFEGLASPYVARIVHAPYPMSEITCVNVETEHPFAGMFKRT